MGIYQDFSKYTEARSQAAAGQPSITSSLMNTILGFSARAPYAQLQEENKQLQLLQNAIHRSLAVIEFSTDGVVLSANDNFLNLFGYRLEQIVGQHHSLFVDQIYRQSPEYSAFWQRLNSGAFVADEFQRFDRNGNAVWIQATYSPVLDEEGNVIKVIKVASDITAQKQRNADYESKINALNRSQAVIEFSPDGTILHANDNFLDVVDYSLAEIVGGHHSLFVEASQSSTTEYRDFWRKLASGEFDSGQYKRLAKNGREVWLRATYNPVFDAAGKVVKVIKFAVDITEQKLRDSENAGKVEAISRSQAVIEFDTGGNILHANDNFLEVMDYSLDDIVGKHHGIFVDPDYKLSKDYSDFWNKLRDGEFHSGEYLRLGQHGREVWIQATYNPIFDADGRVCKIVKFATDISEQKTLQFMIERVIADTSRVMHALSEGKLTESMDGDYSAQFMGLAASVNGYIERLDGIVRDIRECAQSVKSGATEIDRGNQYLSQRTEEQAASLEETSAAMEEMTVAVTQNTENAVRSDALARQARETAEQGGDVVRQAMLAMSDIQDSSNRIGEIIGVIDEIAFQTNLLALNAAVEAARAGEQGRGFGVVADEVRRLAGRSAEAAKQIKSLITESNAKVAEGVTLVDDSGAALQKIVDAVREVNDIISDISTASQEQSTGLGEVNRAVQEMDQMTQQNAALVEEAAAASETLDGQAARLEELVSFFTTVH